MVSQYDLQTPDREFVVKLSMIEIINHNILDLLNEATSTLDIREHPVS